MNPKAASRIYTPGPASLLTSPAPLSENFSRFRAPPHRTPSRSAGGCPVLHLVTRHTLRGPGGLGGCAPGRSAGGDPGPASSSSCDAINHIRSSAGRAECLFGNLAITSEGIPRSLALSPRACGTRSRRRSAAPPRGLVLIGSQTIWGRSRGRPWQGRPLLSGRPAQFPRWCSAPTREQGQISKSRSWLSARESRAGWEGLGCSR